MAINQTRPKDLTIYDPETDLTPQAEIVVMLDHSTWTAPKRFVYNFDSLFPDWAAATEADLLTLLGVTDVVQSSDLSTLVSKVTGKSLIADTEIERLATVTRENYKISLPAGNIATKVAGAIFNPVGWATISQSGATDIVITHTLSTQELGNVTVKEIDGATRRLCVPFEEAYTGVTEVENAVTVEGLNPTTLALVLTLSFV